jgi:hypothetical protein
VQCWFKGPSHSSSITTFNLYERILVCITFTLDKFLLCSSDCLLLVFLSLLLQLQYVVHRDQAAPTTPSLPGHAPLPGQVFTFVTQHVDYTQQQQRLVQQLKVAAAETAAAGVGMGPQESAEGAGAAAGVANGYDRSSTKSDESKAGGSGGGGKVRVNGQTPSAADSNVTVAAAAAPAEVPPAPIMSSRSGRTIKRPKQHHEPFMDEL